MSNVEVLVSGATGFVGKSLCGEMRNVNLRTIGRSPSCIEEVRHFSGFFDRKDDFRTALEGVEVVIHLAGRAHNFGESEKAGSRLHDLVNHQGTLQFADQAREMGVKQFIFLSSAKVNGEFSRPHASFTQDDEPNPVGAYAQSKLKAELGLIRAHRGSSMDVVIIRPPLVYGSEVGGNFKSMVDWVRKGYPFPDVNAAEKRSFVFVENLVDFIIFCIGNKNASNQIFMVSDGDSYTTTELVSKIAAVLGKKIKMIKLPYKLLKTIASLFGKSQAIEKLFGSLEVDITDTCKILGWSPPFDVDEALRKTLTREE